MKFDLPKEQASIIKVIGVGGGGSNAVNHMYNQGIKGVNFVICNTDQQALDMSPVPYKIQLGANLTEGMGAGSAPEIGRQAAEESEEDIRKIMESNTKMIFVTAGMGGGTGTGGAPVIARIAREMGILTVGIVTLPFNFEGKQRINQAFEGIAHLKDNVDSLLIICNDKLKDLHGNLTLKQAFAEADNVLTTGAKGIAEIITVPGYINVDFKDVKKVLTNSGVAIMGSATAEGENRALKAVQIALSSPLLNDNSILGAKNILLNITSGTKDITMDEIGQITGYIQDESGFSADEMIWGNGTDESLGEKVGVTVIATGFKTSHEIFQEKKEKPAKIIRMLDSKVDRVVSEDNSAEASVEIVEPKLKNEITEERNVIQGTFMFDPNRQLWKKTEYKDTFADKNGNDKIQKVVTQKKQEEILSDEAMEKKSHERISRLKELSMKLRTPSGVSDLEKEPAYLRRKIELDDVPPSSNQEMSRFTLTDDSEDGKGGGEVNLRPNNNSFLHDNVD